MNSRDTAIGDWRSQLVVRGVAIAWVAALLLTLSLGLGFRAAAAGVSLWGSIGASVLHHWMDASDPRTTGAFEGRFELRTTPDRWQASLTLEPRVQSDLTAGGTTGTLGVTGAFVSYHSGTADLFAGRLILPVETARLTLPYALTPPDESGRRWGLEGVRADLYLGSSRVQVAAVRENGRWTPLAAFRHAFSGWEATGHLILHEHGPAAGLGWSGLVGSTVVYGETWSVPGEPGLRYSAGASGYLGDFLWTGELARAPFLPGTTSPASLVALQVSHVPIPGLSVVVGASVALDDAVPGDGSPGGGVKPAHFWGVTTTYELTSGESEVELSLRRSALPLAPATLSAGLGFRYFF